MEIKNKAMELILSNGIGVHQQIAERHQVHRWPLPLLIRAATASIALGASVNNLNNLKDRILSFMGQ